MGITVDFLTGLGIEEEIAKKVFAERGKEIERDKAKLTAVEADLKNKNEAFDNLSKEFETLKANNATAEDFKKKFEDLQNQVKEKETKAEEDRKAKEKADGIANRFNAVLGDKKFGHEAIKADYLRKFGEALENKDFQGKSDAEIFTALTKDDANAFEGFKITKLAGATSGTGGKHYTSKEEISKIKDPVERQNAIANNLNLYGKGE